MRQGAEAAAAGGGRIPALAVLVSLFFHLVLGLVIALSGSLSLKPPREAPKAIDLVSIKDLLPEPPAPPPPVARASPASTVQVPTAPAPAAPTPASPAPEQAASSDPGPALAEDLGPASDTGGGMRVATGPAGGSGSGAPAPAAAPAKGSGAEGEPEYLPQFKIDEVPIIPARTVLSRIEYPPLAARQGIEANVFLELFIDETGRIRKITVLKDPGHGFAAAAVAALRGVVCTPAMVEGQPVAVRYRYPVRFTLK